LIFYDFGMMGRYVRCSLWLVQTCSNKNSPVAHILSFMVRFGFTNMIGITSCSISPNIREGLLETFYGVYEKDPDKVDAFNRPCSIMLWIFYYKWSLYTGVRFFNQWFKWVFLSLLEIWLPLGEQHNSFSTGSYEPI
jgi:hypothetical protein